MIDQSRLPVEVLTHCDTCDSAAYGIDRHAQRLAVNDWVGHFQTWTSPQMLMHARSPSSGLEHPWSGLTAMRMKPLPTDRPPQS